MNATERFGASDTYTELRTLGEGASGKVVLARHDASGELVAIKHLAPRLVQDEAFLERFRGEAEILSSLRHPNIAGLHWYVESESEALLAIEAVNGVPLRRLLETGPTEPEAALVVLQGSLRGLHYAHDVDIVHRDYKPENVLVETDGNSRLIDFGIAVPVGESGVLAGTPRYMAPEQWQNGEATPQTDVYAAAAVCYECLVGERPFEATTLTELRTQHLTAAVPLEKLPEALRDLIARGMAKDSAERFETAGAFLAELEVVAAAAYGPDWAERGRKALAAAVAALALLLPLTAPAGAVAAGGGTTIAATVLGGVLLLAGCITAVVLTTHHGSSPVLAAAPGSPPTSTSSTMPSTSTSTSTSRTGSSSSSRSSASPASSGSSSTSTRSSGSSSAGGSGSA